MCARLELMMLSLVRTYYCVPKYSNIYNLISTVVNQLLTCPTFMKTWWVSFGWRMKVDWDKLYVIRVSNRWLSVVVSNMSWGNLLVHPVFFHPHGVFHMLFGSRCWGFWVLCFGAIFIVTMLWVFVGLAQHRVDRLDLLVWSGQETWSWIQFQQTFYLCIHNRTLIVI